MVTLNRLELMKHSIQRFCEQTYPAKELVIVPDGGQEYEEQVSEHVRGLNRPDIKVVPPPEELSLGALRNFAIGQAAGDVLCVWDDDDLHHPRRLELQFRCLIAKDAAACLLADYLHYFPATKELYWCDYSSLGGLPGTLMFKAGLDVSYPDKGPRSEKSEDETFQRELVSRHKCVMLPQCGFLYVYVCHGTNVWNVEHHRQLVKRLLLPFEFVQPRLKSLYLQLKTQMEREFPLTLICKGGERIHFERPSAIAARD
jgi:glycosyltransferase involved in cell wall biosynthesis